VDLIDYSGLTILLVVLVIAIVTALSPSILHTTAAAPIIRADTHFWLKVSQYVLVLRESNLLRG